MAHDQNSHPLTAASVRKRMLRTSEEYWDRLQREYRRAVAAEYPNPGRKDCPGTDALRDLAEAQRAPSGSSNRPPLEARHAMRAVL